MNGEFLLKTLFYLGRPNWFSNSFLSFHFYYGLPFLASKKQFSITKMLQICILSTILKFSKYLKKEKKEKDWKYVNQF